MTQEIGNLFETEAVAEWEESRFVGPDSGFAGAGWPWCTCCPEIPVGLLDSETRTTTTYEGDPTVVGPWTAGSGASFVDYTPTYGGSPPPGAVLTVSVEWRFKLGIDLVAAYGETFPTTQTLVAAYTLITREAGGLVAVRTPGTEGIALGPGSTRAETAEISVAAPGTSGQYVELAGEIAHPPVVLVFIRTEASRWKWGFREYGAPSEPPKYYARETAAGSVGGCLADGVAAMDFDGEQSYSAAGALTDLRAPDAVAEGYFSEARGRRIPDMEEGLVFDSITGTRIARDLGFQCGEDEVPGGVVLELSEEVATAALEGYVDGVVSGGATDATGGTESLLPEVLAWRRLAGDESYYGRARSAWKLALDLTGMEDSAGLPTPVSVAVAAAVVTTDLATGARVEETATGSISTADALTEEAGSRLADAPAGKRIHVEAVGATGAPVMARAGVTARATTDAVAVWPG